MDEHFLAYADPPEPGGLSDQELRDEIRRLSEQEEYLSYVRWRLRGRIVRLRAERVERLKRRYGRST